MGLKRRNSNAPRPMKVAELKAIGSKLYGLGWQTRMAEALNVSPRTVRRWVSGAVPVPGPVAMALRASA